MGGKKKGKVVDLWKVVGERKVWYNTVEMAISIQSHCVSHYCTPLAFSSFFFFSIANFSILVPRALASHAVVFRGIVRLPQATRAHDPFGLR